MSTDGMSMGASQYAGIAEGIQGIIMSYQGAEGSEKTAKEIEKWRKKYPVYTIPESIVTATDIYRQAAQSPTLAGQNLYEQQIGSNTAQGISQAREVATSASDLLGATTSMYGQQNQALTNLQIEAARQQAMNRGAYGNMLGMRAQYEDKAFTWNEAIPWQTRMNELQNTMQSYMDLVTQGQSTLTASYETFGGGASGGSYAPQSTNNVYDPSKYSSSSYSNMGYINPNTAPQIDTSQYNSWENYLSGDNINTSSLNI